MDRTAPHDAFASPDAAIRQGDVPAQCRNCGSSSLGAYCAHCGQETTLVLPTARQFLKDAAGRYVAFDGRLWRTLARLMFHPGFLTREYFAGRRRRYVRPARLFLVLSIVLFAALRLAIEVRGFVADDVLRIDEPPAESSSVDDSARAEEKVAILLPGLSIGVDNRANIVAKGVDGVIGHEVQRRLDRFNALSSADKAEQLYLGVMRYGPYAVFALLPAFAFLLWAVYLGRHVRYPGRPRRYAEHLVFAAHNHAFFFAIVALAAWTPWRAVNALLFGWALAYGIWSVRNVYGGRWIGLVARMWLVAIAYFVLFCFAVAGLVLAAALLR